MSNTWTTPLGHPTVDTVIRGCHSHGDTGRMSGLCDHPMFWSTVVMYFAGLPHPSAVLAADAELQLCQVIHQDLPI